MATGRNGNDFRENEADFDVSREYKSLTNGNGDNYERGRNRGRDVSDRGRDVRETGLVNGGAKRSDSRSDSGRGGEYRVRVGDREPGELSSDSGSDEAINGKGSKIEEMARSHSPGKKRKFSPIVWDRDDMEVANLSTSRSSTANKALSLPPLPKSYKQSPNSVPPTVVQISTLGNDKVHNAEHSTVNAPVDIKSRDSYAGLSLSPRQKENVGVSSSPDREENFEYVPKLGKPEEEDYVSAHTIRSSRWANDANSPVDDGEISDVLGNNGTQSMRKTPTGSVFIRSEKQEISPDIGEFHKEDSDGNRARSPESYENGYHIRSSSSDDYPEKDLARRDYINLDEDHSSDDNGANVRQSYTDYESDDGSRGAPQHVLPPQRSVNMLQGCRSVDEFERLNKIDEGTYGVVFRAKDKKTEEVVALKKVKMEKEREGFPLTSLREINILLSFDHPSVVDVKEVVVGSNLDSIFMVMEYMEHDLKALMETMKQPFSQSEVKCLMLQLLEGTKYLHDNWVLHRDLKTSNILLNNRGELKICDFGLSRQYGSPLKPYTLLVVTLWYRAPELLLGAKQYSTAIDMWSLGCIMAELLSKQPLFNGKTEFDQLDKIFKTLGTPNESIWPGFSKLPGVKLKFVKQPYNLLRRKFPATSFIGSPVLSDAGFDLLNKLLTYDPEKRITAEAALNHEWFREVPLPKSKDFMPTFPAHHAQDRRTRRVMKSPDPLEEQRIKELKQAKIGTGSFNYMAREILLILLCDLIHTYQVIGVAWMGILSLPLMENLKESSAFMKYQTKQVQEVTCASRTL